jgi:hypothetical protein
MVTLKVREILKYCSLTGFKAIMIPTVRKLGIIKKGQVACPF